MQGFGTTGISKFKDKGDNTKMALRTIRTEGDSVLEKICRPVEKNRQTYKGSGRRHAGNHV